MHPQRLLLPLPLLLLACSAPRATPTPTGPVAGGDAPAPTVAIPDASATEPSRVLAECQWEPAANLDAVVDPSCPEKTQLVIQDYDEVCEASCSGEGGAAHGPYIAWYHSGSRESQGQYDGGGLRGTWQRWDRTGQLLLVNNYDTNGELIESTRYRDGQPFITADEVAELAGKVCDCPDQTCKRQLVDELQALLDDDDRLEVPHPEKLAVADEVERAMECLIVSP